jgi:MYXO-CTERM domain-containing protein
MISGTPTQVGTYRFVVKARDSATGGLSAVDLGTFELLVEGGGGFSITTASLPGGNVGSGYDVTIETMGGGAPYVWRISEGRLPPGVDSELNPETGRFRIVGTPTEIGTANILVEVIEASGRVASKAFTLDVQAAVPPPSTPTETKGGGCSCDALSGAIAPAGGFIPPITGQDASSRGPAGWLAIAALLLLWRRRR